MSIEEDRAAEELYEALGECGADLVLCYLSDGVVRALGSDGLYALRLIANALFQQLYRRDHPGLCEWSDPRPDEDSPLIRRARALVEQPGRPISFVVCYNLSKAAGWHMHWSDDVDAEDAYRLMLSRIWHIDFFEFETHGGTGRAEDDDE